EMERTGFAGVLCDDCELRNPGHVIDDDPDSAAEIVMSAGIGIIGHLSVRNPLETYSPNTFVGFKITNASTDTNHIGLKLLGSITINTWLDGSIAESKTGQNALLSVDSDLLLSGSGSQVVGFLASEPFDEVEIRFTNLF